AADDERDDAAAQVAHAVEEDDDVVAAERGRLRLDAHRTRSSTRLTESPASPMMPLDAKRPSAARPYAPSKRTGALDIHRSQIRSRPASAATSKWWFRDQRSP